MIPETTNNMTRILTIIGATGIQGSSVVNAALDNAEQWHIRALTRDPSSEASKTLSIRGVEVLKADLNDHQSVVEAFEGSHAIFAATDFFGPFAALGANANKAIDVEWTQTKNIIEAAKKCQTLHHFVYSTLPHARRISHGKVSPPHFEAKNRGEDMIRQIPALLAKTTFALVGWYASNSRYPTFQPAFMKTADTYVQLAPVPEDVPLSTIGDPRANIGKFVTAILQKPSKSLPGRYVHVAIEETSMGKLLEDWSDATEKTAVYVQTSMDAYDALWPGWGDVEGQMLQFYDQMRGMSWLAGTGEKLVTAGDLDLEMKDLVGVREAIRDL